MRLLLLRFRFSKFFSDGLQCDDHFFFGGFDNLLEVFNLELVSFDLEGLLPHVHSRVSLVSSLFKCIPNIGAERVEQKNDDKVGQNGEELHRLSELAED